jgi:2-amino-4-hydroxy-6-hydroxymethyldihydropteridine diphosphokinase
LYKVIRLLKILRKSVEEAPEHPDYDLLKSSAIALGSNIGDSQAILEAAIKKLAQTPGIQLEAKSSWYKTKAVGPPQPDYLNGCVVLRVEMQPQLLLETLLAIEQQFGRIRRQRWGPRSLDLDLLLYDDLILDTPTLQIPHPRMRERAFVLVPLAEIAPDWVEPVSGRVIKDLAQEVDCSDVHLLKGS